MCVYGGVKKNVCVCGIYDCLCKLVRCVCLWMFSLLLEGRQKYQMLLRFNELKEKPFIQYNQLWTADTVRITFIYRSMQTDFLTFLL